MEVANVVGETDVVSSKVVDGADAAGVETGSYDETGLTGDTVILVTGASAEETPPVDGLAGDAVDTYIKLEFVSTVDSLWNTHNLGSIGRSNI